MRRVAVLVMGFFLLTSGSALAQDFPKFEIGGGYQFFSAKPDNDPDWTNFKSGWYGEMAGNLTPIIGLVFQATGNYTTIEDFLDVSIHNYLGGFRVSGRKNPKAVPYGQFLIGVAKLKSSFDAALDPGEQNEFSETDLAWGFGAGVTVGTPVFGVRGGFDYLKPQAKEDGEVLGGVDTNGWRFLVGVNFAIGG